VVFFPRQVPQANSVNPISVRHLMTYPSAVVQMGRIQVYLRKTYDTAGLQKNCKSWQVDFSIVSSSLRGVLETGAALGLQNLGPSG
jgi:hypothetical protein